MSHPALWWCAARPTCPVVLGRIDGDALDLFAVRRFYSTADGTAVECPACQTIRTWKGPIKVAR